MTTPVPPGLKDLDAAIRAQLGAHLIGVSVDDSADKGSWTCVFTDDVTQAERDAAQSIIDGFTIEQMQAPAMPRVISDRQFFQALAMQGAITQDEALAAVRTGAIPEAMQTFIDAIPDQDQRFGATMLLSGAVEFDRSHPLVESFRQAMGWTVQQTNDLWRLAATL
jgi:hypothetical protein